MLMLQPHACEAHVLTGLRDSSEASACSCVLGARTTCYSLGLYQGLCLAGLQWHDVNVTYNHACC